MFENIVFDSIIPSGSDEDYTPSYGEGLDTYSTYLVEGMPPSTIKFISREHIVEYLYLSEQEDTFIDEESILYVDDIKIKYT